MFLVKAFRAHKSQCVLIPMIDIDMMSEQHFAELCLDGVMQDCLPYSMKILISQVKRQSPGNGVVHYVITNIVPAH